MGDTHINGVGEVGAPERAQRRYGRILSLRRKRGSAGVLAPELHDRPEQFGRSPRNLISELRQDRHLISGRWEGRDFCYRLPRESESPTKQLARSKPSEQIELLDSRGWYERQTGKPRPSSLTAERDLPLPPRGDAA
jgi:hypothetical protein